VVGEEIRCGWRKCRQVIEHPRKDKEYCSDNHRKLAWLDRLIPRCPHCGKPLEITVSAHPSESD